MADRFPSASVEDYDPGAQKWVTRASLLEPRALLSAVTDDSGHVYALVGSSQVDGSRVYPPSGKMMVYNSGEEAWGW
jgi:hypothetical protein